MVTGIRQAKGAIKGGLFISVIVSGLFHAIDELIDDILTWHHFVGGMAVDVTLAVAATGITLGMTSLVTTGPLVIAIIVGVLVLVLFDAFIDSTKLSKQAVAMLQAADSNFQKNIHEVQRKFIAAEELSNNDVEVFLHRLTNIPEIKIN